MGIEQEAEWKCTLLEQSDYEVWLWVTGVEDEGRWGYRHTHTHVYWQYNRSDQTKWHGIMIQTTTEIRADTGSVLESSVPCTVPASPEGWVPAGGALAVPPEPTWPHCGPQCLSDNSGGRSRHCGGGRSWAHHHGCIKLAGCCAMFEVHQSDKHSYLFLHLLLASLQGIDQTFMDTCVHTYTYMHTYIQIIRTHVYTCTYVCTYISYHTYIHVMPYMCVCVFIPTECHMHMQVQVYK